MQTKSFKHRPISRCFFIAKRQHGSLQRRYLVTVTSSHNKTNGARTMQIEQETYDKIAKVIHSDSSPVGIDAKKTHILILQMLTQIDERLQRLEALHLNEHPSRRDAKGCN